MMNTDEINALREEYDRLLLDPSEEGEVQIPEGGGTSETIESYTFIAIVLS